MENYYMILGVSPQATEKEIKAAYRKLAKKYHPDVVKDDPILTKKMYEIQGAYETIGNLEKRKEYDKALQNNRSQNKSNKKKAEQEDNNTTSTDMSQFERFFGFQAGKGMETYQDKKQQAKKAEGPIKAEDLFASFFGPRKH